MNLKQTWGNQLKKVENPLFLLDGTCILFYQLFGGQVLPILFISRMDIKCICEKVLVFPLES